MDGKNLLQRISQRQFLVIAGISAAFLFSLTASVGGISNGSTIISLVEVRELTNSTALIVWETKSAAEGEVEYGTDETYGLTAKEERPDTKHEIALTNLLPDTLYHFRIRSKTPSGEETTIDDATFKTLAGERGQVSICGWDGDSLERVDTFCETKNGWAKGESWTHFCGAAWSKTTSRPVQECVYGFSKIKASRSVDSNDTWEVSLEPNYTGWIDILEIETSTGKDKFLPAVKYSQGGLIIMDPLKVEGEYKFRFRPADDYAFWSEKLIIRSR